MTDVALAAILLLGVAGFADAQVRPVRDVQPPDLAASRLSNPLVPNTGVDRMAVGGRGRDFLFGAIGAGVGCLVFVAGADYGVLCIPGALIGFFVGLGVGSATDDDADAQLRDP